MGNLFHGLRTIPVDRPIMIGLLLLVCISICVLYSAADGHFNPWALRQFYRFAMACALGLMITMTHFSFWMRMGYSFYGFCLVLLIGVEFFGRVGMGAQRWIDLYIISIQPSELMKIALIMGLVKFLTHPKHDQGLKPLAWFIPLGMIFLPALLVMRQPDLGTAMIFIFIGGSICLIAGFPLWMFGIGMGMIAGMVPVLWGFLRPYQQDRILTFLDPERDPLGDGYHILQSKIALGSGGFWGKGFLQGTQGHLDFLPEKQTDFIFTMFCEEFGFIGGMFLLSIYIYITARMYRLALHKQKPDGRLLMMGIASMFFFYYFINMAMVVGLLPVVGIPLPFMTYGGTAMVTMMVGFGLFFSANRWTR